MTGKMNCWEFMKCGRELGGQRAGDLGVCPAAIYPHADGLNGGVNGGRICWAIVGTYSCHIGMSSLSQKNILCHDCKFHRKVLSEEGMMAPATKKGK
jgi:hypothetical protein